MKQIFRFIYIIVIFVIIFFNVFADETQLERANKLFKIIRCDICNGQTIYSSDTQNAINIRKLVYDYIQQGFSDAEIISILRQKFGNQIILSPPINANTYFLWYFPIFMIIFISVILYIKYFHKLRKHG